MNMPKTDQGETKAEPVEPAQAPQTQKPKEIGGRKDGTDPTRYGDWEKNGRCIDF